MPSPTTTHYLLTWGPLPSFHPQVRAWAGPGVLIMPLPQHSSGSTEACLTLSITLAP